MAMTLPSQRSGTAHRVLVGAVGGAIAGMTMAMMAMLWSAAAGTGFWMPLQMIASLPLGQMPTSIALGTAIPVGLISHMMLSMMFGIVFVALLAVLPALRASSAVVVITASVFGTMLWIVNFYGIAPALGRTWFTSADAVQQFVTHTIGFGTVLGLYAVRSMGHSHDGHSHDH